MTFKYKAATTEITGESELWKIHRLGFILNQIQVKYDIGFNELFLIMFLNHFKYADVGFIADNKVTGKHKFHYVKIMVNKLANLNLVDKTDFTLDKELAKLHPENVYSLTGVGRKLANKINEYLGDTHEFLNFEL